MTGERKHWNQRTTSSEIRKKENSTSKSLFTPTGTENSSTFIPRQAHSMPIRHREYSKGAKIGVIKCVLCDRTTHSGDNSLQPLTLTRVQAFYF